ncbi:hypothetical protein QOZ80_4BG0343390 [Eleusine coracana subsp. coracana]|nr:hypothetical protein QOZ80_4BG0343390 [Eleusine coracana subsp. coracana]
MRAKLQSMKPDALVFEPPEISCLSMVDEIGVGLSGGIISSTHKGLTVLYTDRYQPGFGTPSSGCYLVYDASNKSLCANPQIPKRHTFHGLGLGAAIVSLDKGYLIAELVKARSGFPNAQLFLWQSDNPNCKWIRRKVCLPERFAPGFNFRIDMVFIHTESQICWVDLLKGVLVCNLVESGDLDFTFVPLPNGYSIDLVHGGFSSVDITLKTWTLHDLSGEWVQGKWLCMESLWKSKSFVESGLPRLIPLFPVLSVDEAGVVYVVLNDVDLVHAVNAFGDVYRVDMKPKAHYMVRLDMVHNEVICHRKIVPQSLATQFPYMLASDLSAHLQGSKDRQGGLESTEAGTSRKRKKHADRSGSSRKLKKH